MYRYIYLMYEVCCAILRSLWGQHIITHWVFNIFAIWGSDVNRHVQFWLTYCDWETNAEIRKLWVSRICVYLFFYELARMSRLINFITNSITNSLLCISTLKECSNSVYLLLHSICDMSLTWANKNKLYKRFWRIFPIKHKLRMCMSLLNFFRV